MGCRNGKCQACKGSHQKNNHNFTLCHFILCALGALINPIPLDTTLAFNLLILRWVITAAHCTYTLDSPDGLYVIGGFLNIDNKESAQIK